MKLVAMINFRNNPQVAYRELTTEADDYDAGLANVRESFTEGDQLLSVRRS